MCDPERLGLYYHLFSGAGSTYGMEQEAPGATENEIGGRLGILLHIR